MKIVSFGSVNRDLVYSVGHIVSPGETISCTELNEFWGGKGLNQCVALARAGADAAMAGCVSEADSALGAQIETQYGIDASFLTTCDTVTGHAVIQIDSRGQNSILVYPGANHMVTPALADKVLAGFSRGDFVLLQHEISEIPYIMRRARELGLRVAFNPSPFDPEILRYPLSCVDVFILNEIECAAFVGAGTPDEMAAAMAKRYPDADIVLTLGKQGVVYVGRAGTLKHGIYDVPVVDTTAAGDTFTGFFLTEYACRGDVPRALALASKASSLAVSRKGATTSVPSMEEVLATEICLI